MLCCGNGITHVMQTIEVTDEEEAIDEISWKVGYEDPAFFRRLFKRLPRITPGAYRRKFKVPVLTRNCAS